MWQVMYGYCFPCYCITQRIPSCAVYINITKPIQATYNVSSSEWVLSVYNYGIFIFTWHQLQGYEKIIFGWTWCTMIVLRFSLRTTEFCFAEFHFKAENCCYKKEGAVYSMVSPYQVVNMSMGFCPGICLIAFNMEKPEQTFKAGIPFLS